MLSMVSIPIIVNVYNLHESNSILHTMGTGFYHTGIEINGYEYSFSQAGVLRTRPRLPEFGVLREQLTMGSFEGGMHSINQIISQLRNDAFQPGAYDVVHLNCNHFSDSFCRASVGRPLPAWINRMASIGSGFAQKQAPTGNSSSAETFAAPGKVSEPSLQLGQVHTGNRSVPEGASGSERKSGGNSQQVEDTQQDSDAGFSSIFSWLGWGTGQSKQQGHSVDLTRPTSDSKSRELPPTPKGRAGAAHSTGVGSNKKKELTPQQQQVLARIKGRGCEK